jgi:tRNA modification GTPase
MVEANIDFIEEGIDALDVPEALALIARQLSALDALLASASLARPLRDGYRVVIAGPVNAGKSSLFNRLVGESRAIVTEIPGTTRDVLRETLVIDGVAFVLHDTAGLRAGAVDRVEAIGMDRAVDATQAADAVLFVVDAGADGLDLDSRKSLHDLDAARSLVVVNKTDLGESDPPAVPAGMQVVRVSAATGHGMDDLRRAMVRLTGAEALSRLGRDRTVLNSRLTALLEEARPQLVELAGMLRDREPLELLAVRARSVLGCYEEAIGRRYYDGLLDAIFTRFCIGK